jgi:hypothetical protein
MESIFKSWFTTILGAAIMALSSYDWFFNPISEMTPRETGIAVVAGFTLMFMRDSISTWIQDAFKAILDKFKGGSAQK